MPYVFLLLLAIIIICGLIMRNISTTRSPISEKDIGKQFKRIHDVKYGDVLQECDEESHLATVPHDILLTIPMEKPVRLVSINNNTPVFA